MKELQIAADTLPITEPMVIRLRCNSDTGPDDLNSKDARLVSRDETSAEFDVFGFSLRIHTADVESLDGDVVLAIPRRTSLHRLIRRESLHNTLLVTEQCDQKCIMCSQPPKKHHTDMFDYFFEAVCLAPRNMTIGLSGGEPFLHKQRLFEFIHRAQTTRPDISFHILTNGQHFDFGDLGTMHKLDLSSILWGIPIYSADADLHDRIVVKDGAFDILQENLAFLGAAGASIELRTVVLKSNAGGLQKLADHITTHQSFANVWAIMQLENIGYGRMNWTREFYDNSISFEPIAQALDLAAARGTMTSLYNFPLCTVPSEYRHHCVASISDWKQKFLSTCEKCTLRSECGGFFQWYPQENGFEEINTQ